MYKTLCQQITFFFLTKHAFMITIHAFAFFAVGTTVAFVFIADAYGFVGASVITATISILTIIVFSAAIMTYIGS